MDPNATLAEIRKRLTVLDGCMRKGERSMLAGELAELVEALDGWLSRGGFLPTAWKLDKMGDR